MYIYIYTDVSRPPRVIKEYPPPPYVRECLITLTVPKQKETSSKSRKTGIAGAPDFNNPPSGLSGYQKYMLGVPFQDHLFWQRAPKHLPCRGYLATACGVIGILTCRCVCGNVHPGSINQIPRKLRTPERQTLITLPETDSARVTRALLLKLSFLRTAHA